MKTISKPLTFKEIVEGVKFIAFPVDGDDSGHGGFRHGHHLFTKLRKSAGCNGENAMRNNDGTLTNWHPDQKVIVVT